VLKRKRYLLIGLIRKLHSGLGSMGRCLTTMTNTAQGFIGEASNT
jgi:hypothetical protein